MDNDVEAVDDIVEVPVLEAELDSVLLAVEPAEFVTEDDPVLDPVEVAVEDIVDELELEAVEVIVVVSVLKSHMWSLPV